MKKLVCVYMTLSLLLCGLALAGGKTVRPMVPEIDLAAPADGTYGAAFEPADVSGGAMKFTLCMEDCYDIVDINTLAPGDTICIGGVDCAVETLERDDDLLVNGGLYEGGFTLRPCEEDNCWKVAMEDDYSTWTEVGETTLPMADDVTFTDGWEVGKEPVTVSGADAVAEAIRSTEMDSFIPFNTTLRVEDGRIAEIVRVYMP